jgi:hypothetical protein
MSENAAPNEATMVLIFSLNQVRQERREALRRVQELEKAAAKHALRATDCCRREMEVIGALTVLGVQTPPEMLSQEDDRGRHRQAGADALRAVFNGYEQLLRKIERHR